MKISYNKRFGKDGTCYSQTIKIDKTIMEKYNNLLMNKKMEIDNNFFKTRTYSENDLKIKSLDYLCVGVNYTNLKHLDLFIELICLLNDKGYDLDIKRIMYRNTIIEVI